MLEIPVSKILFRKEQLSSNITICNYSGGPLLYYQHLGRNPHYYIAGIVSYGTPKCGTKGVPGIYTKTSEYLDWITSKIKT